MAGRLSRNLAILGVDVAAVAERFVPALATVPQVEGFGVFQLEYVRRHPQALVGAVTENPNLAPTTNTWRDSG